MYRYYDLRQGTVGTDIAALFPGWDEGRETVAVLSPHDNDAVLGAAYAMKAVKANNADLFVLVLCDGRAGYSRAEEWWSIAETRRAETIEAYEVLGIDHGSIIRFEYPDFSLGSHTGWILPGLEGEEGIFKRLLTFFRQRKVTRLLVPGGHGGSADHEAAERIARLTGPDAGAPILADAGAPSPIRSFLIYSAQSAFPPRSEPDRAVRIPLSEEKEIREAIGKFASQEKKIRDLLEARREREIEDSTIEVYRSIDPRPPLRYEPYCDLIGKIES